MLNLLPLPGAAAGGSAALQPVPAAPTPLPAAPLPAAPVPTMPSDLVQRGQLLRRSEEHTSELKSLMRISYAVFCLKKKKIQTTDKSTYVLITKTKKTA